MGREEEWEWKKSRMWGIGKLDYYNVGCQHSNAEELKAEKRKENRERKQRKEKREREINSMLDCNNIISCNGHGYCNASGCCICDPVKS